MSASQQRSVLRVVPPARPRRLAKVPFVELAEGRLQGVVSSGSDIDRVYVSSVAAGSGEFSCRTNNNRPCGGARGGTCKHIDALINEAVTQYGVERVARYLRRGDGAADANGIVEACSGTSPAPDSAAVTAPVFARFLRQLAYLELPATTVPLPEMQWFTPAAVR